MEPFVLVIDQGTTSSRAIVFDARQEIAGMGKMEITQHYPHSGWVEHVPEEIWATCLWACKTAMRKAGISAKDIAAIGITNQRETTVLWDRTTGKAIHNAIVWQDRRTDAICAELKKAGLESRFSQKTGLLIDSYFSATKIKWLLETIPGAREKALQGELLFGTIDTYLIWRLTGGEAHMTDATNASRTLIFNIETNAWDEELLSLLDIPRAILPEVKDSADDYGVSESAILGAAIPIRGVAGDQQAAMIGQACFTPGMLKSTLGNSCFALLNTGRDLVRSGNRLLSTVAYRLKGETTYALEGAIFVVGGTLQWLRDDIGVLSNSAESDALAKAADEDHGVYIVPAFSGLAAPWWDPDARGAIFGLTRDTGRPELVRAALEAVGYQTYDMVEAMRRDWQRDGSEIVMRADGGVVASDWAMQFLSDIVGIEVERPRQHEITALGVGWLAGWGAGVWPDAETFGAKWQVDRQFSPSMDAATRERKLLGWHDAVSRTLSAGPHRR